MVENLALRQSRFSFRSADELGAATHQIPLKKPISAITAGAALYVDITATIPKDEMSITSSRNWIKKNTEHGCLKALLLGDHAVTVPLIFKGDSSFEPGSVYLILIGTDSDIPTRQDFNRLFLTSCIKLDRVRLFWRNYRK